MEGPHVMHWLKSHKKTAAALGLGGLLVTGLGLGLADSAQAAGNHDIMVRSGPTTGNIGSVLIGTRTQLSTCTRVQNGIYNSTGFQVAEGTQLGVLAYDDANCQHASRYWRITVPNNIPTSNWRYTLGG